MFKNFFSNFFSWAQKSKPDERHITVMLIGLDFAGKSTCLSSIKGEVDENTIPTVGFDREIVKHGNYVFTYFDLGGGSNIRSLWQSYFANVHGAIYVIDSADKERINEAYECLLGVLKHPLFKGKSILFFANKQDLKGALTSAEIAQEMKLHSLQKEFEFEYNIIGITAKTSPNQPTDPNIKKGLTWLSESISKVYEELDHRVQEETRIEDLRKQKEREIKFQRIRERKQREEEEAQKDLQQEEKSQNEGDVKSETQEPQDETKETQEPQDEIPKEESTTETEPSNVAESANEANEHPNPTQ